MRYLSIRTLFPLAILAFPAAVAAQQFSDFCPTGDPDSEAAVVGYVMDPEAETVVPGATVAASWVDDGARQRVEAQSNLEGLYTLCGLPQGADVQLRAMFGGRRGEAVAYTTDVVLAQQDLGVSLTGEPEEVEIPEAAKSSRAFSGSTITQEDLLALPEMSVYDLLRQHNRLRFERWPEGEVIIIDQVQRTSVNAGRFRGVDMYVDDRRVFDPVSEIRNMSIDEVRQIDILRASEASARYGGDGYLGAIAIQTRDR